MNTKTTIWYGTGEFGRDENVGSRLHSGRGESVLHIYWELAERIPGKAAPIYLQVEEYGK